MVKMANVQKAINSKAGKPELQFMCSASHLIVLYICVKFLCNNLDSIWVMEIDTNDGSAEGWTDRCLDRQTLKILKGIT